MEAAGGRGLCRLRAQQCRGMQVGNGVVRAGNSE